MGAPDRPQRHHRPLPARRITPRAAGRIELAYDQAPDQDPEPEPNENTTRSEIATCLRPFLNQLPSLHREALTLTELGGLSQADAARQLGVSKSGMKSRVQRGRAQLKELLVACCQIDLDRRARITGYEPRDPGCGCQNAAAHTPPGTARGCD
jgi:RNA polymerase sigma-70 factor (ECF subfamily)